MLLVNIGANGCGYIDYTLGVTLMPMLVVGTFLVLVLIKMLAVLVVVDMYLAIVVLVMEMVAVPVVLKVKIVLASTRYCSLLAAFVLMAAAMV